MDKIPLKQITFHPGGPLTEEHTLTREAQPDLWSATTLFLQDTLEKLGEGEHPMQYTLTWDDDRTLKVGVHLRGGVTTPQDLDVSTALKASTLHLMTSKPEDLGLSESQYQGARSRTQDLMLGYDLGPAFKQPATEF